MRKTEMKNRGKVLREASNGNGLISAEGKQFEYSLEKNWKSDIAPKVGMVVEFELSDSGVLQSVFVVNDSQLAKEQAEIALKVAKEKGHAIFKEASARLGTPVLVAWATFAIAWFFLSTITISVSPGNSVGITFWNLLGLVNNSTSLDYMARGLSGDKGVYGFLAIVALAGPIISQFWKHSLSHLGNCVPLFLMLVVSLMIYMAFRDQAQQMATQAQQMASALGGGKAATDMVSSMVSEMMKAFHIGAGGVIAAIASAYLAFVGLKQYLAAKAQA